MGSAERRIANLRGGKMPKPMPVHAEWIRDGEGYPRQIPQQIKHLDRRFCNTIKAWMNNSGGRTFRRTLLRDEVGQ